MCRSKPPHRPKSNVAVRKIKRSRSKTSRSSASSSARRKRNSYIASSFSKNVYPIEHFPRNQDPMSQFHSGTKTRRVKSQPDVRGGGAGDWTTLTVLPIAKQTQSMSNTPLNQRLINPQNFTTASFYLNHHHYVVPGQYQGNTTTNNNNQQHEYFEVVKPASRRLSHRRRSKVNFFAFYVYHKRCSITAAHLHIYALHNDPEDVEV